MLNLGSLWIELWDGSEAVLWVVTSALVNCLLVLLLYYGRNGLERIQSAGHRSCFAQDGGWERCMRQIEGYWKKLAVDPEQA